MKIEIDIEPEEVRELFGLPDTKAVQQLFLERVTDWAKRQHNDAEATQQWLNAMIQGGRQSFDAYQAFLKSFTGAGRSTASTGK